MDIQIYFEDKYGKWITKNIKNIFVYARLKNQWIWLKKRVRSDRLILQSFTSSKPQMKSNKRNYSKVLSQEW